ncbi:hypothetical protein CEP88_01150 [Roseobacter denitrificans]|uniref:Uncharacterized protein n=1 Tax=Roseobacter denitrificans (strain ATCC 33942 / OCh 114) TaxID=375451 RepID=Q167N5_ROSDO|nr:hypothetical protein [Roseobacter denitrificans]ABG31808.1 hypothetical protein RD1_2216 [Roseobacter denitrificans OCh 114]AVL51375.1 hypothetical protein CEP88_01150 [Roseobacter denitrificans]SFF86693.1 hypothetical protein SAMN05443635_10328 [Roseobacter denitrificans OCh 114]
MRISVYSKAAVLSSVFLLASMASASAEQTNKWDMCNWENIPQNVVMRITNRADYDDILRRMFEACPESALSLTDRPTASLSSTRDALGQRDNSGGENTGSSDSSSQGGDGSSLPG